MNRRTWVVGVAGAGLLLLLGAIAACGGGDEEGKEAPTAADVDCGDLNVAPPARIQEAGKIVVASDLSYAPIDFVQAGTNTAIGLDADLARCIVEAWGVDVQIQNTSFDAIIPALTSGQADVIMSAMSDTEERRQVIDFVDYFAAGSGILVQEGNPKGIQSLADLCGKTVAIQVGTVQIDEANDQNAECAQPITLLTFEQNTDTIQALASKRVDAALMDFPVAAYSAANVAGTAVVGEQFDTGPYGIGVRQDDPEVKAALQSALDAMRAGGQYDAILQYWGLEAGALP